MSDSLRPHGLQPARLLCPWDSSGKNAGVGYHFLLQGIFLAQGSNPSLLHCRQTTFWATGKPPRSKVNWCKTGIWFSIYWEDNFFKNWSALDCCCCFSVPKSHLTFFDPMDCHLSMGFPRQEYWSRLPFPSPGDLPWPRGRTCVSCTGSWILSHQDF